MSLDEVSQQSFGGYIAGVEKTPQLFYVLMICLLLNTVFCLDGLFPEQYYKTGLVLISVSTLPNRLQEIVYHVRTAFLKSSDSFKC